MEGAANRLVLGTAQLGLDYGINNIDGKPSRKKSLEILDFAYEKGIIFFDTAQAYGDAEEILGEFIKTKGAKNKIKIITKIKSSEVEKEITESLRRLGIDSVDGCLFHTPEAAKDKKLLKALNDIKERGLAKNIGASVYEVEDAIYVANLDEVDYIQVPYNIFDQRLDKTDFFQLVRNNGKKVFARSAFLQGLLLMAEDSIPVYLEKTKKYLKKLDSIVSKYNLSRKEAALLFSLKNKDIDYVVLGVDNCQQLQELIDIAEREINFDSCGKELKKCFADIEKDIIFPNLWKK